MTLLKKWLLMGVLGLAAATTQALQLDPAASEITAAFQQMGVTVEAPFTEATAELRFDPAQPAQAHVEVAVPVASFDLGDPMYNAEVMKPEWFDAEAHPQATFASESVESVGDGQLRVTGPLTIKGHTEQVTVPVTVTREEGRWRFMGELSISRLAFGIGDGEWRDTSLVADPVKIRFDIRTEPVQPAR